jgi:hypothetical protein
MRLLLLPLCPSHQNAVMFFLSAQHKPKDIDLTIRTVDEHFAQS